VIFRHCTALLHDITKSDGATDEQIRNWIHTFHYHICFTFLMCKNCKPRDTAADIQSDVLEYGLQYQDLEWFTRAAMVRAILKVQKLPAGSARLSYSVWLTVS